MAYQSLGIGSAADDGTGDSLRIGGDKINDNFSELYTLLGTGTALTTGISATSTVVTLINPAITTSITHVDNVKAYYGTGNDLQIWHDGTHSHIHDVGTGNLYIKTDGTGIEIQDTSGKQMGVFTKDGAATLYHNNSAKIATASGGISVTGTVVTSGNIELGTSATLIFEGATADAFETTLTVTDPTADRTITLPNITGTVITTGDTGTVTSNMIANGTIVSEDIANGTIVAVDIANGAVTSDKILDATITGTDIAADTVAEANMANDAIGSAELKTLSTLLIKDSGGELLKTCHCAGV
jgi:hypothetical protein